MRTPAALVFFGAVLTGIARDDEEGGEIPELLDEYVVQLTSEGFQDYIKDKRVLVKFYTPGCGPCKDLAPDYDKAARLTAGDAHLRTKLAELDATKSADLVEKYSVKSDLALKYFVNGSFVKDYDASKRDGETIALWLKNKEDPPIKELTDDFKDGSNELGDFLGKVEDDTFALVAHVKKNSARAKAYFKAVEDTLRDWDVAEIKFAVVWLPKSADPKADAKLSMHRAGIKEPDAEDIDFSGAWSEDRIVRWVQTSCYATVGQVFSRNKYAPMSMEAIGSRGAIVAVVNDDAEDKELTNEDDEEDQTLRAQVTEAMLPLATENPDWRFVIADINKLEDHEEMLLGVKAGDDLRIIRLGLDRKNYHLIGESSITNTKKIKKFLSDAKDKKLSPFYRSQPDPAEEYDEDGVLVLTGNTFQKKVIEARKDVFVLFYSDFCKHSDALRPNWGEMAKKGAKAKWPENDVVIAKMDAKQNECEEDTPHFPKMVFYPAVKASKKLREKSIYSGDRGVNDLFEFVTDTAKNLRSADEEEDEDEDEDEPRKKKKRRKAKGLSKADEESLRKKVREFGSGEL